MAEWIGNVVMAFFGALITIEFTPIKIYPLAMIGKRMNRDIYKRIDTLEKEFIDSKCDSMRTEILDYANSCRNGRKHTVEEWDHIIEQLGKYERFCIDNKIKNDKFPVNARYLRELYTKLSLDGKFEQKKKSGELLDCK